jgi:hypothetical protein
MSGFGLTRGNGLESYCRGNKNRMTVFEDPTDIGRGSIFVIDPTVRNYHISAGNAFPTPQALGRNTGPKTKLTQLSR